MANSEQRNTLYKQKNNISASKIKAELIEIQEEDDLPESEGQKRDFESITEFSDLVSVEFDYTIFGNFPKPTIKLNPSDLEGSPDISPCGTTFF